MNKFTSSSIFLILSLLRFCHGGAGKYPNVSIKIQEGNFGSSLEGLDPLVSYSTGTFAMGCDFEAGGTASIKPTLDVASLPRSIWSKISGDVAGWRVSSRIGLSHKNNFDYRTPKVDLRATSGALDTSIKVGNLNKIEVNKGFHGIFGGKGRISITPRYNVASNNGDVTVAFDSTSGETAVTIDASKSFQTLTVSQQIAKGHVITPKVTSNGDVSVAWKKDLNSRKGDSITTTVYPSGDRNKVNVKWEDGPWVASFDTTVVGFKTEGLTVKVYRKLSFI